MTEENGKTPLQASGAGHPKPHDDGVGTAHTHGRTQSESQGGAYPNPHQGKDAEGHEAKKGDTFHGGQSGNAYHGTGQLGEDSVEDQENLNSGTKSG